MTLLTFNKVNFNYKRNRIINDMSLDIKKNRITGIMGHNGSGKTTVLKLIAGIIEPSSGEIILNGKDSSKKRKKLTGFAPQDNSLFENLTAKENMKYFGNLHSLKRREINEQIKNISRILKIENKLKQKVKELSGGYKKRVSIACSLIHNPEILILDEPSLGLDPFAVKQLDLLIMSLKKKGSSIIISTNRLEEAQNLCEEVIFIKKGKAEKVNPFSVRRML